MVNESLIEYIKRQLERGKGSEEIKTRLVAFGWKSEDIDAGFSLISGDAIDAPPPHPPKLSKPFTLLRNAWQIYKKRAWVFIGVLLLGILISIPVIALFAGLGALADTILTAQYSILHIIFLAILFILLIIVLQLVQSWLIAALICAVKDSDENIGIKESYRRSWKKILPYVWVSWLLFFVIVGGFVLLIVPGVIFTVWFIFSLFIVFDEDVRGITALLKSREYVRGKWGSVCWRHSFILLVYLAIIFSSMMIFSASRSTVVEIIGISLVYLLLYPLVIIYSFLLYKNLKSLKGEFAFAPTRKKKAPFVVIASLGALMFLFLIVASAFTDDAVKQPAPLTSSTPSSATKELVVTPEGALKVKPLAPANVRAARDTQRSSDVQEIATAVKSYYDTHDAYPESLDELTPRYLEAVPNDPKTDAPYGYLVQEGVGFLCVQFEARQATCFKLSFK